MSAQKGKTLKYAIIAVLVFIVGPVSFIFGGVVLGNMSNKAAASSNDCINTDPGLLSATVPEPLNGIATRAAAASKPAADPIIVATLYWDENGRGWREPPPPYGKGPAWITSGSPTNAVWPDGKVGARGPMQFEPGTYHSYQNANPAHQPGNPDDLTDAMFATAQMVADLGGVKGAPVGDVNNALKGTVAWVFGAYNAGPHGDFHNSQTAPYIKDGVATFLALQKGTKPPSPSSSGTASTTPNSSCTQLPVSTNPTGDAAALAKEVLANPNISYEYGSETDVLAASIDQFVTPGPIGSAGATGPCQARTPVKISALLLQLALNIAKKFKYTIGSMVSTHACDTGRHPLGRAMDLDAVNGTRIDYSSADAQLDHDFAVYVMQEEPKGAFVNGRAVNMGGEGQQQCQVPPIIAPPGINYFPDSCDHLHVDVGYAS